MFKIFVGEFASGDGVGFFGDCSYLMDDLFSEYDITFVGLYITPEEGNLFAVAPNLAYLRASTNEVLWQYRIDGKFLNWRLATEEDLFSVDIEYEDVMDDIAEDMQETNDSEQADLLLAELDAPKGESINTNVFSDDYYDSVDNAVNYGKDIDKYDDLEDAELHSEFVSGS